MVNSIVFRRIQAQECTEVVRLHREVFSPEQLMYTIYESPYVERYLANSISPFRLDVGHVFWGAWQADKLIGYTHFVEGFPNWHLNNVGVLENYRGNKIGRTLWQIGLKLGLQRDLAEISLDVDKTNQRALDWYIRNGLIIVGTSWTYRRHLINHRKLTDDGPVKLVGWENAEAWHRTYMFSNFKLAWKEGEWTVGRLGEHYFRVTEHLPPVIESVLFEIDRSRELLIVTSDALEEENLEEVKVSYRLRGPLISDQVALADE